jgi:pimeloyl-ACP methyl ester carboxylesterase
VKGGHVEADGFQIQYLEAGAGEPLVVLHGSAGLRISRSHELLAERHRVVLFEMPGFGQSPPNERTRTLPELAATMAATAAALGIESFNLMGNSFGAVVALWLALGAPERVKALILVAPAAIRQRRFSPQEIQGLLYVHPENRPPGPPADQPTVAKQQALVDRLLGEMRDPQLEARMPELQMPVLVAMGTEDHVTPPELGRLYVELLPNSYLVFVYDAAHAVDGDRPEAFAALAMDFLERKEQFLTSAKPGLLHP